MRYSLMTEIQTSRDATDVFAGYNHNIKISEREFYEMENMSSRNYPVLSPRPVRGTYNIGIGAHNPYGIIAKDKLVYVDDDALYIDGVEVEDFHLLNNRKQLVSMGGYVIIMPDKKYINTLDITDRGDIEQTYEADEEATITYKMCRNDGTLYENITVSSTAPTSPSNNKLWIDTSSTPHVLKQYASASGMWVNIATTYVRIEAENIGKDFKQYDGVRITGIDEAITQLSDLEGQTSVLYDVHHDEENDGAGDYVIVVGILDEVKTQTGNLKLSREMPNLDIIIENQNRLWGCRYGTDVDGNTVNEIYASKQGDFRNWNCFMGISTDSYVASCGTDGAWTGAAVHLGYPIFFKENCLHKVYGTMPSNYQIQTTNCKGVAKGCADSLATINSTLYYKSADGVCAFDGSLPVEISKAFGDIRYSGVDDDYGNELYNGAVAGALNNKYYISMRSEKDGAWNLFVYDAQYSMWHREDNTHADAFCAYKGELYYIDHDRKLIRTVNGSGVQDSDKVLWTAITGTIGTAMPDRKYVNNIIVRMMLEVGTRISFHAQYDSAGEWEHLCTLTGTNMRSFSIPLKPRRCDHFRLRIDGVGDAKLFSITKEITRGSDY